MTTADCLRQVLEKRAWRFNAAVGELNLHLRGLALDIQVLLPVLRGHAARNRAPDGGQLLARGKAIIDLSGTGLTDAALRCFLAGWKDLDLGPCRLCLKLQRNCLSDDALSALADFATSDCSGPLEELHASHQAGPTPLSRGAVLAFLCRLNQSAKYPIWVKRRRVWRPVYIRLANCGIADPECIDEEFEQRAGAQICFANDARCMNNTCVRARLGACPIAHLYEFRNQEPPIDMPQSVEPASYLEQVVGEVENDKRHKVKGALFVCGACSKSLPIDMFTRSQFRKATQMDTAETDIDRADLVRRCNDCVTQPCCACGNELPLSAFAGSQLHRPQGSRRCKNCAFETLWCVRCARPRPRTDFSAEALDSRGKTSKVCKECQRSNPYFDRRHAICAAFSGRYAAPPARLPALAREVLCRILSFARESRFVRISLTGFECILCSKRASFIGNGGNNAPVERHLRTSQLHAKRLRSLEAGHIVDIRSTELEPSRFSQGLGLQGTFCGLDQVREAAQLIDVWELRLREPDLVPEVFREVGCREDPEQVERGTRWANASQVESARALLRVRQEHLGRTLGSACGVGNVTAAEAGARDALHGTARWAAQRSTKRTMLCSMPSGFEDCDMDVSELEELKQFLSS
eukprot:TRINITY_DN9391_c0_g2_i1.p1 TRINITY_DN9391_c0_g2~~TRINITY_DN9391_c0_g2_i1.p1  ORF type:complete len:647 (+),score=64.71 TRINITY_DN9391_c0_g2_i1:32-1942(+)